MHTSRARHDALCEEDLGEFLKLSWVRMTFTVQTDACSRSALTTLPKQAQHPALTSRVSTGCCLVDFALRHDESLKLQDTKLK